MRDTITRTIHSTVVTALVYNEATDQNELHDVQFVGKLTEKQVQKKLILAGLNVVKIKSIEYTDQLREMSQETFVQYSTPVNTSKD